MTRGQVRLAYVALIFGLVLVLGGCCSSPNPWHTAPWEYGYTPKGD